MLEPLRGRKVSKSHTLVEYRYGSPTHAYLYYRPDDDWEEFEAWLDQHISDTCYYTWKNDPNACLTKEGTRPSKILLYVKNPDDAVVLKLTWN